MLIRHLGLFLRQTFFLSAKKQYICIYMMLKERYSAFFSCSHCIFRILFVCFKYTSKLNFTQITAASCLYLASKLKADLCKIKDLVTITFYNARESNLVESVEEYQRVRDSIIQSELLVVRVLNFRLDFVHPHKVSVVNYSQNR